jgi:hypothetical protein
LGTAVSGGSTSDTPLESRRCTVLCNSVPIIYEGLLPVKVSENAESLDVLADLLGQMPEVFWGRVFRGGSPMEPQGMDIQCCTALRNGVTIIAARPYLSNRNAAGWRGNGAI